MIRLRHVVVLSDEETPVDEVRVPREDLVAAVGARAVRRFPLAERAGEVQDTAAADAQSPVPREVVAKPVVIPFVRKVVPDGGGELGRRDRVPQTEVDDPGDRVGAVPRRASIAHDLQAVDRLKREGVHVHAARARKGAAAQRVHDRRGVAAFPVQEDERVVR